MKDLLQKIKEKAKIFSKLKKMNSHGHWMILLSFAFVVTIGLIIFSFYLLFQIKTEQIFQADPKSKESGAIINEKMLKQVNQSFESKLIKENNIRKGAVEYKDPS